jgi:hypothetical protein
LGQLKVGEKLRFTSKMWVAAHKAIKFDMKVGEEKGADYF